MIFNICFFSLFFKKKLITESTFRKHKGFDLANFEDQQQHIISHPHVMNVLKTSTFNDFIKMVAVKFKKQPEQIRFWALVSRQNKTVRPDCIISTVHFGSSTLLFFSFSFFNCNFFFLYMFQYYHHIPLNYNNF